MPASTIERLKQSRSVCTVTFTPEESGSAEAAAVGVLGQQVRIDGFRPGHAPADAVRQRVGESRLLEETVRQLLTKAMPALIDEHKLQPVIPPKVEAVSANPLTLKITFVERPEVKIKGIDKLKIEKKDPKADAKDVQRVIDSVLSEHRTFAVVDRAAEEGDQVVVHFAGKDAEGKEIPGLSAQSYPVVIGASRLLPGFEPQLVGLKKGDTKTFTLTLPDNYGAEELRSKPVTFDVTAQRVEQVKSPALDDEFAKKNLNAESAAAFKAMVEESILNQERQFEAMRRERLLLDEIRNRTQVDLAPELLEEETKSVIEDLQHRLSEQGVSVEDWLKQQNKTAEQAMEEFRKQAAERATLRLGIATLIDERKVELTDDEKRQALDEAMAQFPPDQKKDAEQLMRPGTDLYAQALWQGLVRKMLGSFLA